ncbi:hypothetical protein FRB90_001816 [Tulasnella sp. 427]|nr:hypothetical protein FRB90_001816 [Tulasnella sp. 427]
MSDSDDSILKQARNPPVAPRRLQSSFLNVLPEYFQELVVLWLDFSVQLSYELMGNAAVWFAITSKELMQFERVALAYHGFNLGKAKPWGMGSCRRVRTVEQQHTGSTFIAKRVASASRSELTTLRLLSSNAMANPRNHTATISHVIWGERVHITPFYHQSSGTNLNPNAVLSIAKQLTEAVAFLHENRIAHMDIADRNIVFASNDRLLKPRILLIDMEYCVHFAEDEDPIINLGTLRHAPPEGKSAINAFAYDIYCTALVLGGLVEDWDVRVLCVGLVWPPELLPLIDRMGDATPTARPTAKEAADIMQSIDEDQPLPHSGIMTETVLDLAPSIRMWPCLANGTQSPSFGNVPTEEFDCPVPATNRRPLFHSDDDQENEEDRHSRKPKKAKLTELPPELDAYFPPDTDDADLDFSFADKGADLSELTKEAEARHSRKLQRSGKGTHQGSSSASQVTTNAKEKTAAGSSAINPLAIGLSDDEGGTGDKGAAEEKKRKPLPKLDEARLLGDNGFRALITQTKKFKVHNPKGKDPKKEKLLPADKDPEYANLSRFIEMTQLWAHRMYPKGQFSDTVERVEKLCHSRRMVTAMSVWKDEYRNGPLSSRLHEPSSPPADNGEGEDEESGAYTRDVDAEGRPIPHRPVSRAASSRASSRPPTMPTSASSGASDIDDADLDVIMADMARNQASSSARSVTVDEDDEMQWDIADEIEARAPTSSKPAPSNPTSTSNTRTRAVSAEEEAAMWAEIGGDDDELMAFMDSLPEEPPRQKLTAPPESRTPSLSHSASPSANNATDRDETSMNLDAQNVPPDIQKRRDDSKKDFEAGWDDMYE